MRDFNWRSLDETTNEPNFDVDAKHKEGSIPRKILVVDDEEDIVEMLATLLEEEGYQVLRAYRGDEAIKIFLSQRDIDLIILDIIMPGMKGTEVAKRIKEMTKGEFIPIIFLTATPSLQDKKEGMMYGDEFLNKPVDIVELKIRVYNLLKLKAYQDRAKELLQERTIELQRSLAELERVNRELEEAQMETIYRLALAAEYKDEDTANHLKRVSHYAYILALDLGLPEYKARIIKLTAPMHDIGKIGVPDSILLKPARLTKEEFEIVKRHTVIGAKILSGSPYELLKTAEVIALTHHENYDGTGYPLGLKGEDIPLEGRLITIVDVFDALTSKRPYKEPWEVDRALSFIKEQRERKFDPKIVDSFLNCFGDILRIKAKFSD